MFLTRCPHCRTTFRLNEAQLAARGGRVRCGACKLIFNALENLLDEHHLARQKPATSDSPVAPPSPTSTATSIPASIDPSQELTHTLILMPAPPPEPYPRTTTIPPPPPATEPRATPPARRKPATHAETAHPEQAHAPPETPVANPDAHATRLQQERIARQAALEEQKQASAETVRQQTLEAGLRAPRHARELPGYSPWSSSLLDNPDRENDSPVWPFALAAALLALALATQAVYHYRGDLGRRFPLAAQVSKTLRLTTPLPREKARISIEEFDMKTESEASRLRFLLTLRNDAPYALAWPHLELTLRDADDATLARKVLPPREYLPTGTPSAFPSGNTQVRMLLDKGDLPVFGYQIDYFYP
ncbi:MAG: DUF3426 domain-containing protein [Zoogloeaceae bacterium]|jgi:predicted Zn finger-like uncharacterized protein|nr:DUF3426 domain-containing protein [Zoogloeaceae bacterium]